MNIKILWGENCYNCKVLEVMMKQVLTELNLDFTPEKITDVETIMNYNVMSIPALVIEEKVIFYWRVADKSELLEIFSNYVK